MINLFRLCFMEINKNFLDPRTEEEDIKSRNNPDYFKGSKLPSYILKHYFTGEDSMIF